MNINNMKLFVTIASMLVASALGEAACSGTFKPSSLEELKAAVAGYFAGHEEVPAMQCWDVSSVTSFEGLFAGFTPLSFDEDLSSWATSQVTNMKHTFSLSNGSTFNNGGQPLDWDVSSVTTMEGMFMQADAFNQDLSSWDTSKVTSMKNMFRHTAAFNNGGVPLTWNTAAVTNMEGMFAYTEAFNQDVSGWDVGSVTRTSTMFRNSEVFDNGGEPLDWANTRSLENASSMFNSAVVFNQKIDSWDLRSMQNMYALFWADSGRNPFNQSISLWKNLSYTVGGDGGAVVGTNPPQGPQGPQGPQAPAGPNLNSMFQDATCVSIEEGGLGGISCTCDEDVEKPYCHPAPALDCDNDQKANEQGTECVPCTNNANGASYAVETTTCEIETCSANFAVDHGQSGAEDACLPCSVKHPGYEGMDCQEASACYGAPGSQDDPPGSASGAVSCNAGFAAGGTTGACTCDPTCAGSAEDIPQGLVGGTCTGNEKNGEQCTLACDPSVEGLISTGDLTVTCAPDEDGVLSYSVPAGTCRVPPAPVITAAKPTGSSDSSKDEAKYIVLFVGSFIVLLAFVTGGLYMAGCIGSKAGADVSALPTKAPVQAVEFTSSQETV